MDYKRTVIFPYREFEKHSQDSLVSLGKLQQEPLICTYNIQKRNGNLAQSLGGYLWAISSVATEKIQVRCLKETYIVEIRAVLQIIYIGDGCEGYSPSLAIAAKTEM